MKKSPSFRSKFIFFGLASLVLLGFCLTLATLYAVDASKRRIVGNAQEIVQLRADQLREALLRLLDQEQDLAALHQSGRFREIFKSDILYENQLLVTLIYDHDARHYEVVVNPELAGKLKVDAGLVVTPALAEARRVIDHQGQKAQLVVSYVPDVLLGRIQEEGRRITLQLLALAAGLTLVVAATFLLLWRAFQRHLERERVHEQLDRLAYVGTLASGLAHEIRNPLNALSLNLDIIAEDIHDPRPDSGERARTVVGLLKSEVGRLNDTLTNFLRFALPAPRRFQTVDLVALLHEAIALLAPEMRRRQVDCRYEGDRACMTHGDPAALGQVFWNVLLNALQAVEERDDRRIEVHCGIQGGACRIQVRDTGPGVPVERREQVFQVFHSTRRGGSGFGLPIARQIVERHDGAIWIDSLDGWGAVVHIRLPLRVSESQTHDELRREHPTALSGLAAE